MPQNPIDGESTLGQVMAWCRQATSHYLSQCWPRSYLIFIYVAISLGRNDYPACRTSLIATRFWVVMICPIIKCITVLRVFFYFVWFVFIHHNFQFYFELCTYCNILDIYLSQNLNFVSYLLFNMKLLNYLFFNMFGSVLECCELTGVSLL